MTKTIVPLIGMVILYVLAKIGTPSNPSELLLAFILLMLLRADYDRRAP